MNELAARASDGVTETLMNPHTERSFRRLLAGDADESEQIALAEALGVDVAALAAGTDTGFAGIRDQLRAAVDEEVDVADDVLALLAAEEAFGALGDDLRAAFGGFELDLGDSVMEALGAEEEDTAGIEISAFADGEVDDQRRAEVARRLMRDVSARETIREHAELGASIRAAVSGDVDVWADVARAIGAETAESAPAAEDPAADDASWAPIGHQLRAAVDGPRIDVSEAVMAAVNPPARSLPRWVSLWAPIVSLAAAAAVLFSLVPPSLPPEPVVDGPVASVQEDFILGAVNDAQVEEVEYGQGVSGGIIEPQGEGDVMVIVVDDSALAVVEHGTESHL